MTEHHSTPTSLPPRPKRAWFLRALMAVILCAVLAFLCLYVALGTVSGSRWLLGVIADKVGMTFTYEQGNLRDGIWASGIYVPADDTVSVYIDKAHLKLGWRAVLTRQLHVREADIGVVQVVDTKPSSDAPFDYATIKTPVSLFLENTRIERLSIERQDSTPVLLDKIDVVSATWQNSQVNFDGLGVEVDQEVLVSKATGKIDLTDDYPLYLEADVRVYRLDKHYVSPLSLMAVGSLRRTAGTVMTHYNNAPVSGDFVVSPLEKGTPFSATLAFDKLALPYAKEQNITLTDGVVQASGTYDKIELRTNSYLEGKDIPKGQYQTRANLTSEGMDIDHLRATTSDGVLTGTGRLDWKDDFYLTTKLTSDHYPLANTIPKDYQNYAAYLPSVLNGELLFGYWDNDEGMIRYGITLAQKDGERIVADITTPAEFNYRRQDTPPYDIALTWQNVHRANVPDVGEFVSSQGEADIGIYNGAVSIVAAADLDKLATLPKGYYTADTLIKDDVVTLHAATYQGAMGDLSLDGVVNLPKDGMPLSYQLNARTNKLTPNAYFDTPNKTPVQSLIGKTILIGSYRRSSDNQATHDITFNHTDLTAHLDNKQSVQVQGDGKATLVMMDAKTDYTAKFDGKLATQGIAQALTDNALSFVVHGAMTNKLTTADIEKLTLAGAAGHLSAGGTVKVDDGVAWQLAVRGDKVDTAQFHHKSRAILTGDMVTSGRYQHGKLAYSALDFDGKVSDKAGDVGNLVLNAAGNQHKFTINRLTMDGIAGRVNGTGYVDLTTGVVAQTTLSLQDFNVGRFVQSDDSQLSGELSLLANWQKDEQMLGIERLDIHGRVGDKSVLAQGKLLASVNLPKDLKSYFATLKKPTFNLDSLMSRGSRTESFYNNLRQIGEQAGHLQDDLAQKDRNLRKIINKLHADDIKVQWGDNHFGIDGNEQKLSVEINAQDLTEMAGSVRGQVTGGLVLVGDDNSLPTIYSDLQVNNVSMPNFAVRQGSVLARLVNLGNADSAVVVQGVGVVAFGRSFRQARFDIKGTESHHQWVGFVNDGNLQLHSRVEGGFDGVRYQGVLSEGRLQTRFGVLNQRQPTELSYELSSGQLFVAPHCWQTVSVDNARGSLCLKEKLQIGQTAGHVNAVIHDVDTSVFTPLLPEDLSVKAKLSGTVNVRYGKHTPDVQVVLYSDGGQLGLRTEGLPDTTMGYDRVSLIAKSVPAGLKVRGDIKAGQAGDGYFDVIIDPYKAQKPIAGTVALSRLNLAVFRPFFPALRLLGGEMNLEGGVGGTLQNPLFYGNANLIGGRFAMADLPVNLEDMNMIATIRGNQAKLQGNFSAGTGKGTLSGEMGWHNELQAKIDIQGESLDIESLPLLSSKVSPHVQVLIRPRQKYVDIKGVVTVPSATIRPPKDTGGAVGISDDVVVIDRRNTANVDKLLQKVAPWSINTDIGLDLGDEVVFRGFGAKLPLAGALHLTQSGQGVLQGRGVVQVSERTTVDFLGQNLELNYAQIRFNGDLQNPRLSIEGVRQIDGQAVGVRVTGTAENPQIQVFNDAGLTEEQAMNALVTGRLSPTGVTQISEQGFRSQVTNSLAAAGLSFGLQGTRGVTNEIGRALGLDGLVVDASGSANDANVNITGYITPDLYVRYGVGVFSAETSLSMRYQLTRRVYIEAVSATEQIVDVVYRWRFK